MKKNVMNRILSLLTAAVLCSMLCSCAVPVPSPTVPAENETNASQPTDKATQAPTAAPTQAPTAAPTQAPTAAPTQAPTAAPTQPAPTQPAGPLRFTKETYPRVDGATGMYPMSVEIAKAVIGLSEEEAEDFIKHHTTSKAYYNLIDKKCDLIFVSEPSDDLIQRASAAGVTYEMVGIGRDGFVFVCNKQNPVNSLTLDQIRAIYTGQITSWKEVGGEDIPIIAYQREANSGSQNLMEKMVMQGLKMAEAPAEYRIDSMYGLIDSVAAYENSRSSLGYSIYVYAKEQYVKDSIKFLSINGVYPTDDTIADGSYPLSKIVYAVFRSDEPAGSPVRRLVAWLLTEEGQKAVMAGGYSGMK